MIQSDSHCKYQGKLRKLHSCQIVPGFNSFYHWKPTIIFKRREDVISKYLHNFWIHFFHENLHAVKCNSRPQILVRSWDFCHSCQHISTYTRTVSKLLICIHFIHQEGIEASFEVINRYLKNKLWNHVSIS